LLKTCFFFLSLHLKVKKYFEEKGIDVLSWPPYSPDLNPIENVWSIMKLEVARKRPESIEALKSLLMMIWETISPATLKNLSNSMKRRCIAVIKAKGGPTKY
jgi:transposase